MNYKTLYFTLLISLFNINQPMNALFDNPEKIHPRPIILKYSNHALARIGERGITQAEIEKVVNETGKPYQNKKFPDSVIYTANGIHVPVVKEMNQGGSYTVKTVFFKANKPAQKKQYKARSKTKK